MRALTLGPRRRAALCAGTLAAATALLAAASGSAAVNVAPGAPAACSGVQITDAAGDGHHANTDLTAAWLTKAGGRLQAVLVTKDGSWKPAHDDSPSAGWAVLWQQGGATRYVRLVAVQAGVLSYDAGTWTRTGGFVTSGPTTGAVSPAGPDGWAAIDVPASFGAVDGTVLAAPFALTYDGQEAADLHWVDRAPGGDSPDGANLPAGADVVVGACPGTAGTSTSGTSPVGGGTGGLPADGITQSVGGAPGADALTSVGLKAPAQILGAQQSVVMSGQITPARAGVLVTVTRTSLLSSATATATTDASGRYALRLPITERTQLRATAAGLGSQTLTVDVKARVRITVRRTRSGGAVITGTVSPALPGRVLWLRTGAVIPSATTKPTASGRFSFRLPRPARGRYQALFLPIRDRALRGLSPTGVIR